jgi:hypothetical protein
VTSPKRRSISATWAEIDRAGPCNYSRRNFSNGMNDSCRAGCLPRELVIDIWCGKAKRAKERVMQIYMA